MVECTQKRQSIHRLEWANALRGRHPGKAFERSLCDMPLLKQHDGYSALGVGCEVSGIGRFEETMPDDRDSPMYRYVPDAPADTPMVAILPRSVREHYGVMGNPVIYDRSDKRIGPLYSLVNQGAWDVIADALDDSYPNYYYSESGAECPVLSLPF